MELMDLYDEERQKQKTIIEKGQKIPSGLCSLRVHLCLFNSKGEMLIQQRHKNKKHWPEAWDISLSGGAQKGDSSKAAITREVKEEFGLDIDFSGERAYFTINADNCFDDFYIIERDIDLKSIHFDDGEVQAVKWAGKDEILKLMKNKKFIQYYPAFINAIFEMRAKRGIYLPNTEKY